MKTVNSLHWGKWVESRARHVGFLRKRDLAASVGCQANCVSRWVKLQIPPARMLKGFDASLVAVLKTDRRTLFSAFSTISPTVAPIIEDAPELPGDDVRSTIREGLNRMNIGSLHVLRATMQSLVETGAHAA